jgi:hypothetical protein
MERAAQRRVVDVDRGLFLVRYVAAEDPAHPPIVTVTVEPDSREDVEVLLHPDHKEPVLSGPSTSLVIRAIRPGKLGVSVEPRERNGSVTAKINIEPVKQGDAVEDAKQGPLPTQSTELQVLGHVAGIGDVRVKANEWLAGPTAPSRIEGVAIECPGQPGSLGIGYAVKTAQPHPISGRVVELGSFAGTRGRGMPLTSLMFELSGPEMSNYQFVVEALFLGSPIARLTGPRVVVSGPTGREPLVGLRVALEATNVGEEEQPKRSVAQARSSSRIRVFRSNSKQARSVG